MVYRDLLTVREDTAFVSNPVWKASKLSPEPLWVAIRDVHAIYWRGLWHDSGNNKPLPQESSNLSLVLPEESTKSSCSADLAPRSKLSQAELQNLICQQMSRGGSKPLLSFKPPYVWNLVAQKDQQGDPALGGMGQMPTRVHRWATSCPAATAVPFFFSELQAMFGEQWAWACWSTAGGVWQLFSFIPLYVSSVCEIKMVGCM